MSVYEPRNRERATSIQGAKTRKKVVQQSRTNSPVCLTSKVKRRLTPLLTFPAFSHSLYVDWSKNTWYEDILFCSRVFFKPCSSKSKKQKNKSEVKKSITENNQTFFSQQEEIVSICQVSIKYNRQVRKTTDLLLHACFSLSLWLSFR